MSKESISKKEFRRLKKAQGKKRKKKKNKKNKKKKCSPLKRTLKSYLTYDYPQIYGRKHTR